MAKIHKKKWAKSTGGYGNLDDHVLVDLPGKMKEVIGKAATHEGKSQQAFMREAILEKLLRMQGTLRQLGATPPISSQLITKIEDLRILPELSYVMLTLKNGVENENVTQKLAALQERLAFLESRVKQRELGGATTETLESNLPLA